MCAVPETARAGSERDSTRVVERGTQSEGDTRQHKTQSVKLGLRVRRLREVHSEGLRG